jgi:serine/threonine protein kinase
MDARQDGCAVALDGFSAFSAETPVAIGGTGRVFRARRQGTGRDVALKVWAGTLADRSTRERFESELAVWGRLGEHPLLATIHEHGVDDAGRPYLVMPWYERGSLAQSLGGAGPLPARATLTTGIRLAAALDFVHGRGVVHGDVKPENVLISGFGDPVLADFGCAAWALDASLATSPVTPVHAAPEVLSGGPATAASDVWSLCSTLYTTLTGDPPSAEDPRSLLRQDGVATELADVIASGLDRRPERRPSAAGLLAGLLDVQATLGFPRTPLPGSDPVTVSVPADVPMPRQATAAMTVPRTVAAVGRNHPRRRILVGVLVGALAGMVLAAALLLLARAWLAPGPTPVGLQRLVPRIQTAQSNPQSSREADAPYDGDRRLR